MRSPSPRVLVVDDEPSIRLLCRVNLELDGYRVLEAGSREQLLRALTSDDVAGVLLDVHLGGDDGFEVARELKAAHPHVPIAFFSGSVEAIEERAGDLAVAFLPKPFSLAELSAIAGRLTRGG